MRYNRLGRTGLSVSELCLGTMTFGSAEGIWGQIGGLVQDEADALVKAAVDAGVNFIDTANVYSCGLSERILGQSLKDLGIARDQVVIATKALGRMGPGPNNAGASRGHIMSQIDASLDRLQLDHIDLYQIHGFDNFTPVEETLDALDDLVRSGRVRYVGLSNWAAWQVAKAVGISERKGLAPIASLQSYYTVVGRDLERDVVPMLKSEGVGLMVWSPLAGGYLSGKYRAGSNEAGRRATFDFPPVNIARGEAVLDVLDTIAKAKGRSTAQIALSWLLHQPAVSSVIIGAKRPDQLADNLAAVEIDLTADDLAAIDTVSKLPPEYPGWMLERQGGYRDVKPHRGER